MQEIETIMKPGMERLTRLKKPCGEIIENQQRESVKRVRIGFHRRVVRTLGRASSRQTRRSSEGSKTPISLASSKPYF